MKNINPGEFRNRITFLKSVDVENEVHETTKELQDYASVWASVEPLKGREYYEAQTLRQELTYKIRIRYSPSLKIDPSTLIKFGNDRIFQIIDISNIEERNRILEIHAIEKVKP